jgi:hypothetical protein
LAADRGFGLPPISARLQSGGSKKCHSCARQTEGRASGRATAALVSPWPAFPCRLRGTHQRAQAPRWSGTLPLPWYGRHEALGRWGRGE